MPGLPQLDDGRVAVDHRHDALVVVLEGRARLAGHVSQNVRSGALTGLERHGAKLREKASLGIARVGKVAEHVRAGETGHGEVGLDVDPSAMSLCETGSSGQRRRLEAPRPYHDPGPDGRAV